MIYTKTGDDGTTSLVGGTRVEKCNPRLDAYGTADELNSHVGLLRSQGELCAQGAGCRVQDAGLEQVQNDLFVIGSVLACEEDKLDLLKPETWNLEQRTSELEAEIDRMTERLPRLHAFVLPSGHPAACEAHVCRTVCRRLEREMWKVGREAIPAQLFKYVNRLSDYFFVLARWLNLKTETEEQIWKNK